MENINSYVKRRFNNLKIKINTWNTGRRYKKLLKGTDFSIISNNCWGSFTYQKYGLRYNTPTVALAIMEDDFIKMCQNLRYYMTDAKMIFIQPRESKYYSFLIETGSTISYPIGKLDDVEIHFMHYANEEEAIDKWTKRKERINWDKLLIKLSDRGQMTSEMVEKFANLPYKYKILFSGNIDFLKIYPDTIYLPELCGIGKTNIDETPYAYARCDTTLLINSMYEE